MRTVATTVTAAPSPRWSGASGPDSPVDGLRAVDDREERDRQHHDREPRQRHVAREGRPRERLVREHDQVRQVRARQQQRGAVRHEQRAVEERPLVALTLSGRVQDDRRDEDDGGVQVQDSGHDGVQRQQRGEQDDRAAADPLDARSERGEQPVRLDDGADHQQAGDEYERRPRLARCVQQRLSHAADGSYAAAGSRAWISRVSASIRSVSSLSCCVSVVFASSRRFSSFVSRFSEASRSSWCFETSSR